jgi:hypothetical protein
VIAAGLALALAPVPFEIEPLHILGIGRWDCATAFHADRVEETWRWIAGFWTGRNAGRTSPKGRLLTQVGRSLDEEEVVAEVERACRLRPTASMAAVANDTFDRLAQGL